LHKSDSQSFIELIKKFSKFSSVINHKYKTFSEDNFLLFPLIKNKKIITQLIDAVGDQFPFEFVIREGGVPEPKPGKGPRTVQDMMIMGQYWHIGYPSLTQLEDETIIVAYHEYSMDEQPIQYLMLTRFIL